MRRWKQIALESYYAASQPLRRARNARLAAAGRAPIVVVMYHRVADDGANAWTTRTDVFCRQIAWLKERFELVSLAEAQRRIAARTNHRPAVSITFDDGYADNCRVALPLLVRQQIPFTYFVTSGAVLEGNYFPHDLAMGNRLKPNTPEQLRELLSAGVEIGAHTRSHADLGRVRDPEQLHDEVVAARDELSAALGCRIRYFAFPFGQHRNLCGAGFQLAAAAGFEAVVSAYGGYNFPGDDPFHLQRMGVDGPLVRLKNLATLDPYKQWKVRRYFYPQSARVPGATPQISGADHFVVPAQAPDDRDARTPQPSHHLELSS